MEVADSADDDGDDAEEVSRGAPHFGCVRPTEPGRAAVAAPDSAAVAALGNAAVAAVVALAGPRSTVVVVVVEVFEADKG